MARTCSSTSRTAWLSLTGYSLDGLDDGTNTQVQLMDGLQVPLDASYGQPSLLPQGHHQAYQIDPQALLAQNHPLQGLFGQPAPLAYRTDAGYQGVLGHFYRSHR